MRTTHHAALAAGLALAMTLPVAGADSTPQGELRFPEDYREWIFLSAGLDMSYFQRDMPGHSMFDNVFAEPHAYQAFRKTGTWPDGTVLVLEVREAAAKGSINVRGHYQAGDVMGIEAHVKDARFKGGWGFFAFDGKEPAQVLPGERDCYSCHARHAAVDTTFVQFYPTLLPIARHAGTVKPGTDLDSPPGPPSR